MMVLLTVIFLQQVALRHFCIDSFRYRRSDPGRLLPVNIICIDHHRIILGIRMQRERRLLADSKKNLGRTRLT